VDCRGETGRGGEIGVSYGGSMDLVWPTIDTLDSYADALGRGWSPDTMRPETSNEQLDAIVRDAAAFVASLVDREAAGDPIPLPDGTFGARLPGFHKWMWDGEFCGSIGFRWQAGTAELPPHVLGHIGYSVVPWKRRRGYATRALALVLADAAAEQLEYVELTTDPDNVGSQRVIEANGGVLTDDHRPDTVYGTACKLRYRIALRAPTSA
jgi:predicted acetyltransferase